MRIRILKFASLMLALVSGCGRSNSDTSTVSATALTVVGNLADWPGAVGSFAGYIMVLYNVDTGEVHRATIAANSTGFSISGATTGARYNAILLDPEYRFGWILQIPGRSTANTGKYYQTFSFAGAGVLGSLTSTGKILNTSEQSDLVPDETISFLDVGTNNIPDGLEGSIADNTTNSLTTSDMDNDGIPNAFDSDIDNDGISNWLDPMSGTETNDKDSAWSKNPLVQAAQGTIFRHVVSEVSNTSSTKRTIMPLFTAAKGQFSSVTVESGSFLTSATYAVGSEAFAGVLYDDGTHGDGVAGDGNWSIPIVLAGTSTPSANQVMFIKGTQPDGTIHEYVVPAGSTLESTAGFVTSVALSGTTLGWTIPTALNTNLKLQVLIFNANNARVYASDVLASTVTSHSLSDAGLTSGTPYSAEVRVVGPSPRNGFQGNAWRSAGVSITYP